MRRREFIAGLGSAAAWPAVARAQQPLPVIAFLTNSAFEGMADRLRAFKAGLREIGFAEGTNVVIELNEAKGDLERLSRQAAELARRQVNVIVANGLATQTAKDATSTIPIVFTTGADPVETGIVASLSRPGGNLTGVTALGDSLGPKRLQLLHQIVPAAREIAILVNPPNSSNGLQLRDLYAAAQLLGLSLKVFDANTSQDFDDVFQNLIRLRAGALVIATAPLFNNFSEQLAALSVQYKVPASYQYRDFAAGGGLISFGADPAEVYRWLGVYSGRILKGERPAQLPVQQVTKIQLILNKKTAEVLGITFPEAILATADEVIE
jgi:putative tryptophan/tyrosine transport system substrate-binding protein